MSKQVASSRPALLSMALIAALLAGCATAPAPNTDLLKRNAETFRAAEANTSIDLSWWQKFDDPQLNALVEKALRQNLTLVGADGGVAETEARLRRVRQDRSPDATSQTSAEFGRPAGPGGDGEWSYSGRLSASWELDIFGVIRQQINNAEFNLLAAQESRRDLATIVASETALAYLDLRGAQVRLDVARRNAKTQEQGLELIRTLRENGRASQLDLERAISQYRTTLASIPTFEAAVDNAISRLATLTSENATNPGADLIELAQMEASPAIPTLSGTLSSGTPGELIRRRPDIRLAEARLGAALALGQSARAALFPTISLTATGNGLFDEDADFSDSDNLGFGIGPVFSWAGPDIRRAQANIEIADAQSVQAIANYEQTVLAALSDTEIALSNYVSEKARSNDLTASKEAAERALNIATLRFQEGLDDYLDVLDAQRTLLDAEDRLALNQLETARRAVRAYRSLGGIWDNETLVQYRNQ